MRLTIPLPPNVIDETGHTYGRLTVIEFAGSVGEKAVWLCLCTCCERIVVRGVKLRRGEIVSCGCERSDPAIRRAARLKVPPDRRRAIAAAGALNRWNRFAAAENPSSPADPQIPNSARPPSTPLTH